MAMVVLININLAVLNLLPIPVLDGGHMLFATLSRIARRPLPLKLVTTLQTAFIFLFLSLAIYVSFFDVGRVGRSEEAQIEAEQASKKAIPIEFKGPAPSQQPH